MNIHYWNPNFLSLEPMLICSLSEWKKLLLMSLWFSYCWYILNSFIIVWYLLQNHDTGKTKGGFLFLFFYFCRKLFAYEPMLRTYVNMQPIGMKNYFWCACGFLIADIIPLLLFGTYYKIMILEKQKDIFYFFTF